jgi:hypothetical protein
MDMDKEEASMKYASRRMKKVGSFTALTSMMFAAVLALGPMLAIAPPTQGDLDVVVTDLAPLEHTFPGDTNVTMLWIRMTATGGNVVIDSLDFTLGGTFDPLDVSSVVLWSDATGVLGPDKKQSFGECELARITNPSSGGFTLPPANLNNCVTPFGAYTINQFQTRYILVFVSISSSAIEGGTINLTLDLITSDATSTTGDTGASGTVEILSIFFSDDMESGQGGWTREGWDKGHMHEPNGLWHLSTAEGSCWNDNLDLPYHASGSTSWWYGRRYEDPFGPGNYLCSFDTWLPGQYLSKTRNMGNLTTPNIDATTGSSLAVTFRHMLLGEGDGLTQPDNGHLWLYDGTWHKVTPAEYEYGVDSTDTSWWKETINLSAYAGKVVQLELRFDTLDYFNNMWLGWFVDDLVVYGKTVPHDIHVSNMDAPPVVSPSGGSLDVSADVSNIGSSDETGIVTRLTVDNATVDTGSIPSLNSGQYVSPTLTWSPTVAGVHWICFEADPVPGETIIWNNKNCKVVSVIDVPVHYIYVVRSQGTTTLAAKNTWDHLNANWGTYGSDQVIIDYSSLDMPGITYADISGQSPKPDTLVISSSGGWINGVAPPGGQFTNTETAAIEQYVLEGHGLVLTGTVFNELIPNNNDLTGLVGVTDQAYMRYEPISSMDIEPSAACNPLTQGVSDPFTLPYNGTMTPTDGNWGSGDVTTGTYCARSPGGQAAIVVNKGVYMMSIGAERGPNADVYQLIYNAMVNALYQVFDHDVKAENIIAPNYARVNYPVNVSATIKNIGKNDEDITVNLEVNSMVEDTTDIFLTATGGTQKVTLSYIPATQQTDLVCIKTTIIGFTDQDPSNNDVCTNVESMNNPPVQVFILDSWGTDSSSLAPWANLNSNWNLYGTTPVYIDWTKFNKESIQYQELVDMNVDVMVISNSFSGNPNENPTIDGHVFSAAEMTAISNYVNDGHGLIVTGSSFNTEQIPTHASGLGPVMGINGGAQYMTTYGVKDMKVQNPAANHPLFYDIPTNYNTRNGTSLTPGFSMTGPEPWDASQLSGATYEALEDITVNPSGPYGAVIAYEPGTYNTVYITGFVERLANTNDKQLLYNAMVWARSAVKAPSDLWVELWNGNNDLRLTWTENPSTGLVGYNIYHANTVDTFNFGSPIASGLPAGTTEYIDFGAGSDLDNHYYIVRAYDSNGNEEMNMNIVGKFMITLYPKVGNEISIPFELKDTTTSVVFSQLAGRFDRIEAYDAQLAAWKSWTPTGGTLQDVDHTMGLRVTLKPTEKDPIPFVTVGQVRAMTDISLYHNIASAYWNFVGFPRHLNTPLPDVLDNYGMAGKYDMVLWYDPQDKKQRWKWFDPNDPSGSPLTELRPGMGIWVHTTQAGTWTLPGS